MWPQTVRKDDLKIDYFRGSGPGGQKKNKTSSACRITHIPTGIVTQSQEERSQSQNLKTAFRRLCDKLVPLMKQESIRERYAAGTTRVRTYHFPEDRVIDERVPGKVWRVGDVLDGKTLDDIIQEIMRSNVK